MALSKQQIQAMRWLYEDDKSFIKAVQKLRAQDIKENQDNEQLKQYYKQKIQQKTHHIQGMIPEQVKIAPTAVTSSLENAFYFALRKFNFKYSLIAASGLILTLFAANTIFSSSSTPSVTEQPIQSEVTEAASTDSIAPTFDVPLPSVSTVSKETIKFDNERQVASFVDRIGSVSATISMQPLPDDFKDDITNNVKELAEGFGASTKLTTTPVAFRGSTVEGVETVIFNTSELLVFIQSASKLDNEELASYIGSFN